MFKEILGDVLPLIEKSAPILGMALTGPYMHSAVIAISLLAKAFGGSDQDIPSLVEKITNDPSLEAKLKQVQSDLTNAHSKLFMDKLRLPDDAEINIKLKWNHFSNNQ